MANPSYRIYTTAGEQAPWNADWAIPNFNVTVAAVLVSGTASYAIEYTLDDCNNPDLPPRWIPTVEAPYGTTTTAVAKFNFPFRYVRLNIASLTGQLEMKCLQGHPNT